MTILPIAQRELRVASRKRSTFWLRLVAALVALLIGSGFLILISVRGIRPASYGDALFSVVTWLSLGGALFAGLFLTSDTVSEEKRDGTLGLLFLTDLRGYDVISGKLLVSSLRGFYALLAAFPVLAISLMMGGVSGWQFWKTCLALLNALILSTAVGLFVSTVSRDSQKALAGTLLFLLLLVAGGPTIDATIAASTKNPFNPILSLTSPGYCFVAAQAWFSSPYWWALLTNQLIAWLVFSLSCRLVTRTWQDKPKTSSAALTRVHPLKFGAAKPRSALRQKILDINPVLWLASRERWQTLLLWLATCIIALGLIATFIATAAGQPYGLWFMWTYLAGALTFLLYIGIASQAGRFLVQARRSGLLELLLSTPLNARQIVQGQWHAFLRGFRTPLLLWSIALAYGAFQQQQAMGGFAATTTTATRIRTPGATNRTVVTNLATLPQPSRSAGILSTPWPSVALSLAKLLSILGNLIALFWFGMWMGLNSQTGNLSTLKTIAFVQVIPWFVVGFASALIVPLLLLPSLMRGASGGWSPSFAWYPFLSTALASLLFIIKDIAFILWSRRKLYSEFHERASSTLTPARIAVRPPIPTASLSAP